MKRIGLILALVASFASAKDVYHQGYVRKDGTYVQPHYQTAPDKSSYNNYSSQGNYNPYTGQLGTVNPYQPVQPTPNIYQPPQQPRSRY